MVSVKWSLRQPLGCREIPIRTRREVRPSDAELAVACRFASAGRLVRIELVDRLVGRGSVPLDRPDGAARSSRKTARASRAGTVASQPGELFCAVSTPSGDGAVEPKNEQEYKSDDDGKDHRKRNVRRLSDVVPLPCGH
jgi:hypothetical protein